MLRKSVTITTDAAGDGTGYIDVLPGGCVLAIIYAKTDYANGVTLAVTAEETGEPILTLGAGAMNASVVKYPRIQVHDGADGTALTLDGTRKNVEPVMVVSDRIKFVVAAGGDTKTGTFTAVVG